MMHRKLTRRVAAAKHPFMKKDTPQMRQMGRFIGRRAVRAAMVAGCVMALSACISVNAPDKPIVIELNINIKQEVIYRLAADAGNTIEQNADIF